MRAMAFAEPGGLDVLQLMDLPKPTLDVDEVLVQVKACALNHLDLWVRKGLPTKITMPHIGGCETAGEGLGLASGNPGSGSRSGSRRPRASAGCRARGHRPHARAAVPGGARSRS